MSREQINDGAISKIDAYKWGKLDAPGTFALINKGTLLLDERYQRNSSKPGDPKVLRIARDFSWAAFGTLHVAQRPSGLYVFEGGHRLNAARLRSDITDVPCMVYQAANIKEEASAFLRTNLERKPMGSLQRLPAQITSEDADAVYLEELVNQAGYQTSASINPGQKTIKCVGTLLKLLKRDREAVQRSWPMVVELAGGGPIKEAPLQAIVYLETFLRAKDESTHRLTLPPWRDRLMALGMAGVEEAIQKARNYYGKGGERVYAAGLVLALNYKVRYKLPSPMDAAAEDESGAST